MRPDPHDIRRARRAGGHPTYQRSSLGLLFAMAACAAPGVRDPAGLLGSAATTAAIAVRGDTITAAATPLPLVDLPREVASAVESIAPGGDAVEVARVRDPHGEGFRVTKRYAEGTPGRWRSVRVDADGVVLERSHEIRWDDVRAAVQQRITAACPGDVERVDAVQGAPQHLLYEGYRTWRRRGGERWIVECGVNGADLRVSRLLAADLTVELH